MTGPVPLPSRRQQIEWMLLATALLLLGALIGDWHYDERGRVEALERDRLQLQARVIADACLRLFREQGYRLPD